MQQSSMAAAIITANSPDNYKSELKRSNSATGPAVTPKGCLGLSRPSAPLDPDGGSTPAATSPFTVTPAPTVTAALLASAGPGSVLTGAGAGGGGGGGGGGGDSVAVSRMGMRIAGLALELEAARADREALAAELERCRKVRCRDVDPRVVRGGRGGRTAGARPCSRFALAALWVVRS